MVICFYSAVLIIHFQALKKPHLIKNVALVFWVTASDYLVIRLYLMRCGSAAAAPRVCFNQSVYSL